MPGFLKYIDLTAIAVADNAATTEASGSLAWSTNSPGFMVISDGANWRRLGTVTNTDGNVGVRIHIGAATPTAPATGDVWIN